MALTPYCTRAQVAVVLSEVGVDNRVPNDANRDTVIDAMIERATAKINNYCFTRYETSVLATSEWVTWCCVTLVIHYLNKRRNNPGVGAVAEDVDDYLEELRQIKAGTMDIAGLATRYDTSPSVGNYVVDRRYKRSIVRRVEKISTGGPQVDGLKQHTTQDDVGRAI